MRTTYLFWNQTPSLIRANNSHINWNAPPSTQVKIVTFITRIPTTTATTARRDRRWDCHNTKINGINRCRVRIATGIATLNLTDIVSSSRGSFRRFKNLVAYRNVLLSGRQGEIPIQRGCWRVQVKVAGLNVRSRIINYYRQVVSASSINLRKQNVNASNLRRSSITNSNHRSIVKKT